MAKFVPDITTRRWVVIAPGRVRRPKAKVGQLQICPFCPGNERLTPPEVSRIGPGAPNTQGWKVRVVPNKYPITDMHEVIIHSPDHEKDLEELPNEQVRLVLESFRSRYQAHSPHGNVLIFSNRGEEAGASLSHPHSQLVVIPYQINLEAITMEPQTNLVLENTHFLVFCPDFSQWPYEVWIAPKRREVLFSQISDEEIFDLAKILQDVLMKLCKKFPDLQYNLYIYHTKDWFLRIIPRLVYRAGFELGTGLSVNIVDPVDAAKELRELQ
jgi:UDPglucose--hexose-1-phosphate uridylyltransferase